MWRQNLSCAALAEVNPLGRIPEPFKGSLEGAYRQTLTALRESRLAAPMLERLVKAFTDSVRLNNQEYLRFWQQELLALAPDEDDLADWQELVRVIRDTFLSLDKASELRQAALCYSQLNDFIHEVQGAKQLEWQLAGLQAQIYQGRKHLDLTGRRRLSDVFKSLDGIFESSLERAFVVLYDQPAETPTDFARLQYAWLSGQRVAVSPHRFVSHELLPPEFAAQLLAGNLLLIPLHVTGKHYGYMLLEPSRRATIFYEGLASALVNAIRDSLQLEHMQTQTQQLQEVNSSLAKIARFDELTGLPNRVFFREKLEQAFVQAQQTGNKVALIFLDLDSFKYVNDSLGHSAGDQLLTLVAQRLKKLIRSTDTVARLGGDEFTIIMRDVPDGTVAVRLAQVILQSFAEAVTLMGRTFHVSCSMGIALYPEDGQNAEILLKHADTAMYQAKAGGKNRYHFFTQQLNTVTLERLQLEQDLRQAVGRDFYVVYQPRFDVKTGEAVGVEALLRWRHNQGYEISPSVFIPMAERLGLIHELGNFVLKEACLQTKRWQAYKPLSVSVNLSVYQLQERTIIEQIRAVLEQTTLEPQWLELEITESAAMTDVEENITKLQALKDMGVRIAIDDFGTAYSSLNYLKRLPISSLKIDKSFVQDITTSESDSADATIIKAVIALGRSMGFSLIAEGVETPAQYAFLKTLGCDEVQGFLFGRPVVASQLAACLDVPRELGKQVSNLLAPLTAP